MFSTVFACVESLSLPSIGLCQLASEPSFAVAMSASLSKKQSPTGDDSGDKKKPGPSPSPTRRRRGRSHSRRRRTRDAGQRIIERVIV